MNNNPAYFLHRMKSLYSFLLFALALLPLHAQKNHNFETAKALDIFNALYRDLDLYYVDTLDAEKTVGDAILYMLGNLDPYTEFYKEDRTDELRTLTTGKYAGIGSPIRYHKASDRCAFDGPYMGMPAHKAGVRSGDVILKVDGKDVGVCGKQSKGEYSNAVTQRLRGQAGTTFTLTVQRPGVAQPMSMRITRQKIVRPSVVFHTVLPDSTGYVLLELHR